MRIKAENLSFSYSPKSKDLKVRALQDINLTIEEGDFFGIVGHTGSGKSTFVQHLNGLIKVQKDSGKVTVGEFDLTDKKCDFKALRKKTAHEKYYFRVFGRCRRADNRPPPDHSPR